MEEIGSGYKTTVKFTPRDDNAAIVLIAELDGDNLGSLYLLKKEYVEDHRARFPQGDFRLSRAAIAGFPALKLDFQIGQAVKEEAYIFFFDGVRFDLIYSGRSDDDFTRHYKEAFSSLSTVEPKRRALR